MILSTRYEIEDIRSLSFDVNCIKNEDKSNQREDRVAENQKAFAKFSKTTSHDQKRTLKLHFMLSKLLSTLVNFSNIIDKYLSKYIYFDSS